MDDNGYVLEVPSSLKQLARLVARGFYSIEDALIVDMLVRNPCMKEDDICDLLKFERKMLRSRIATLRTDKFLQVRLKMETVDNKTQKVNYYYINYKTFVNIVKYKLDHMRKRMEVEERDATSRASFKCPNCKKTFTDLEADQLFDPMSGEAGEFRCYMCRAVVEEDQSALPKKDSRLLMARFNEQMEALYMLLREVEDVKLAPSLLEPEPTDISHLQRDSEGRLKPANRNGEGLWSGEATRGGGFRVEETRVDVTIGDDAFINKGEVRKEKPIWMTESTVITGATVDGTSDGVVPGGATTAAAAAAAVAGLDQSRSATEKSKGQDSIMSVLLAHEQQKAKPAATVHTVDSSDDESMPTIIDTVPAPSAASHISIKADFDATDDVELLDSDDDDDDQMPMVTIGDQKVPLNEVVNNSQLIAKMTPAEKDAYIHLYQEHYAHMYD